MSDSANPLLPSEGAQTPNLPDMSDNQTDRLEEGRLPQALMAAFVADGLEPGQRAPSELDLAARFGVGRPAIREALRALEALGFLEARKGSGRYLRAFDLQGLRDWLPYILAPNGSNLLDLLRVRQVLEVSFLSAAAARLGRRSLEELEDLGKTMVRKAAAGQTFVEEDHRFHAVLHEDVGNSVMLMLVTFYWEAFESVREPSVPDPARLAETAQHHLMIARALIAGDIAKAQYHMDAHFYDVAARLSEHQDGGKESGASGMLRLRMIPT